MRADPKTPHGPPRKTHDPAPPPVRPEPSRRPALEGFFAPQTIALIGASDSPGSVGRSLAENLVQFPGNLFFVNPKRPVVMGRECHPSIGSIASKIDLAVIATPSNTVPAVVKECGKAGVKSMVVVSAGFKESGPEGAALEAELLANARKHGGRVIGPNCLGLMVPHAGLNATFASNIARAGKVAFISQSGALCTAILDWSLRENVGFSAFVSVGSMMDVGWGDLIYHLGDDPCTSSIICYMESVGDARSFLSAAREVALSKPIIVIKVGRTEDAARAAASHTGSLTGSDEVLDAAFRRAGVLRVDTIEQLFDMAEVLAKQPRPKGPRLAIVTNAGGPGALAVDQLIRSGGKLAELGQDSLTALNAALPPHWSRGNPVDLLGDATPALYAKAVEVLARDSNVDGVLTILTPQAMTDAVGAARSVAAFAHSPGKPILASWMGGASVAAGEEILSRAGVPTFAYPDRAAQAFDYMWQYSSHLRSLYETPVLPPTDLHDPATQRKVQTMLEKVRRAGRTILTEPESKQVLCAYGIPVVETHAAETLEKAVELAQTIGFPVAIKLLSQTVTHKGAVGGVHLNVLNVAGVHRAWRAIEKSARAAGGLGCFQGVSVQPMVQGQGFELILGSSTDSQFGPVILFGLGGRLVEAFRDQAIGLPPLNAILARRLMGQTRIYQAMQRTATLPQENLAMIEEALVRFSCLVADHRCIKEMDLNPLLVTATQVIALDARVILHDPSLIEEQIPKLAIRPYPSNYVTPWKLRNGLEVTIRPIRPEDEPWMVAFHQTLSERSVYLRYFSHLKLEQRIAHERLSRICFIDYDREMALVVERRDAETGQSQILGVGRLSKSHGLNEAEFALSIADPWQKQGLGTRLLELLVQVGRDEKLARIRGVILADNREMQAIARKVGFRVKHTQGNLELEAELEL